MEKVRERPAMSPEARENQMVALAIDCCEARMRAGKASSQEIVHYLKIASQKNRLEIEILEKEKALLEAKAAAINTAKDSAELYAEAIKAFRTYSGQADDYGEEDYDDDDYYDENVY